MISRERSKMRINLLVFVILLASFTTTSYAEPYRVDIAHSRIVFKIKCLIIGNITGRFKHFSGSFEQEGMRLSAFFARCRTDSIDTGDRKRDRDLRSVNFFDSIHYPEMTLKMIRAKKDRVLVRVSIRGITKYLPFSYTFKRRKGDQKNRSALLLEGELSLSDFKLDLRKAAGAKSAVLGKKVKIMAEIEGRKIPHAAKRRFSGVFESIATK